MRTITLGSSGLVTSVLGMGCAKLGSASTGQSRRDAVRLVGQVFDLGVRLFDTADAYGAGQSESVLGEALRTHRDEVVVASKVGYLFKPRSTIERQARRVVGSAARVLAARRARGSDAGGGSGSGGGGYQSQDFSAGYVRAAVLGSLRRLGTDRIDLLQFHGPPAPDDADALPDVIAGLLSDGLIRAFGIGCESLDTAAAWVGVPGLACLQVPFGVLDPQAARSIIPNAHARGIGVLVRGVLGGGILARQLRGLPTGLDAERQQRVERLDALARDLRVDLLQIAAWYALSATHADAMLLGITSIEKARADVAMVEAAPPRGALERIHAAIGTET